MAYTKYQRRLPWSHGRLIPLRVVLRDFAAKGNFDKEPKAETLWDFIETELKDSMLYEFSPHLRKELHERGGLLLFDGLDEVPEAKNLRNKIKYVIEDFASTFHKCRVLVTSRTYAYQKNHQGTRSKVYRNNQDEVLLYNHQQLN